MAKLNFARRIFSALGNVNKFPLLSLNEKIAMSKTAYNIQLKGYVGGWELARSSLAAKDATIAAHEKTVIVQKAVIDARSQVQTKLTMKRKKNEEDGTLVVERNDKGEVLMSRYNCVTTHTARRSGITNMYLTHKCRANRTQCQACLDIDEMPPILSKFTILQMMHVSGHKTEKTFRDYIKLSSDEIADEIDAIFNGGKSEVF